jgi:mRNA-degrading endonuclease RelE of RelBE toxin-antitoxin system
MPAGRQNVYKIELPKRVTKQLDKVPNKEYLSIAKSIQNLKENPRPVDCNHKSRKAKRKNLQTFIKFVL